MIQAVIFDMDGLMIDSERVTYEGYVTECEKLGTSMDKDFYKRLLGLPKPAIFRSFHDQYGQSFPIEQVMVRVHQYMEDRFRQEGVPVKEGLAELLTYLKAHDYKTVVATSSTRDRVDRILAQTGLIDYFDGSVCGDEVERGKPDPDIFLKACRKADVPPAQALVLEDSETGIEAAHSAGIPVICIPDMKYPAEKFAKKTYGIAESLSQVLPMLQAGSLL